MRRNRKVLFVALAVGALVFTGAAAFTNSIDFSAITNTTVGYGALSVSGATVDSIVYNTNTSGSQVTSVDFVVAGDTTGSTASLGFNADAPVVCDGTYSSGLDTTSYTCDYSGSPVDTASITTTDILFN